MVKEGQFVPKGTVLMVEDPYVHVVKPEIKSERCNSCLQKLSHGKMCTACKYVYYCGKKCQKAAWPMHKLECKYLAQIFPSMIPDGFHTMVRILFKLKKEGNKGRSYYTDQKFRTIDDLMSHKAEIIQDKERMGQFYSYFLVLRRFLLDDCPPKEAAIEIYGKILVNSFGICDDVAGERVAKGVYLGASVLDHSCCPTAAFVFNGLKLYLRAMKDFSNFNWKDVTISYIEALDVAEVRKAELEKNYYFVCNCERCNSEEENNLMNSMQCPNKSCKSYIPLVDMHVNESLKCESCTTVVSRVDQEHYHKAIDETKNAIKAIDSSHDPKERLAICEKIIEKYGGILYDYNIYLVKILLTAINNSSRQKSREEIEFITRVLPPIRQYDGRYNPHLTLLLLKFATFKALHDTDESSYEILQEANDHLIVTHGIEHPVSCALFAAQLSTLCEGVYNTCMQRFQRL